MLLFSARRLVAGAAQACFEILQPVAEQKKMQRLRVKEEPLLAPSLMYLCLSIDGSLCYHAPLLVHRFPTNNPIVPSLANRHSFSQWPIPLLAGRSGTG